MTKDLALNRKGHAGWVCRRLFTIWYMPSWLVSFPYSRRDPPNSERRSIILLEKYGMWKATWKAPVNLKPNWRTTRCFFFFFFLAMHHAGS